MEVSTELLIENTVREAWNYERCVYARQQVSDRYREMGDIHTAAIWEQAAARDAVRAEWLYEYATKLRKPR